MEPRFEPHFLGRIYYGLVRKVRRNFSLGDFFKLLADSCCIWKPKCSRVFSSSVSMSAFVCCTCSGRFSTASNDGRTKEQRSYFVVCMCPHILGGPSSSSSFCLFLVLIVFSARVTADMSQSWKGRNIFIYIYITVLPGGLLTVSVFHNSWCCRGGGGWGISPLNLRRIFLNCRISNGHAPNIRNLCVRGMKGVWENTCDKVQTRISPVGFHSQSWRIKEEGWFNLDAEQRSKNWTMYMDDDYAVYSPSCKQVALTLSFLFLRRWSVWSYR